MDELLHPPLTDYTDGHGHLRLFNPLVDITDSCILFRDVSYLLYEVKKACSDDVRWRGLMVIMKQLKLRPPFRECRCKRSPDGKPDKWLIFKAFKGKPVLFYPHPSLFVFQEIVSEENPCYVFNEEYYKASDLSVTFSPWGITSARDFQVKFIKRMRPTFYYKTNNETTTPSKPPER